MGYTVYWNQNQKVKLEAAAPDIRELLEFCDGERPDIDIKPPKLAGALGQFDPILTGAQLIFNGTGEEAHESFYLDDSQTGFSCCKTERKPYDTAVKAALVLIQSHCDSPDDFRVGCDGSKMDWVQALSLLHELFSFEPETFLYSPAARVLTERELLEEIETRLPGVFIDKEKTNG